MKILAVASAGGHWVQLRRIAPAFAGGETRYLTTMGSLKKQVEPEICYAVKDANMSEKLKLIPMTLQIISVLLQYRPDVIISTGAAPGFMALVFGKLLGARTIWLDSIANPDEMSLAGRKVRRWADHWLTQWPELAKDDGPTYIGSVI